MYKASPDSDTYPESLKQDYKIKNEWFSNEKKIKIFLILFKFLSV
jgi:hypothetical protein